MVGATVPEATIDKNGKALSTENEIGAAKERQMAPPPFNTVLFQYSHQSEFSFLVTTRTDGGHDFTAVQFCENVRHAQKFVTISPLYRQTFLVTW